MSAVVFSNGIQRNKVSDMFQGLSSLHLAHSPAMEHNFQHLDDDVQGKRSSVQTWLGIPVSEGSTSSVDSMPSGDIISPSDFGPSIFHNSGINAQVLRLDPPLLLSDDESGLDILSKKPMLGRSVLQESSDNLNTEEGLPVPNSMDDSCSKVKLMCSFGGKILPRPSDGKLRYVGGETRISCISRDITYAELLAKMRQYYDQAHTFKYQLPDEDLDALISVSTDEDLENMIEEYDRREAGDGSSKLRVFLFSASDDVGFNEPFVDGRNSEQRYVDAVNGVFEGMSGKQSVDNLVSLDALDTNCMPHAEEIPVGVSGPLHMHASTQAHLKPHSAPASAPNSPNLLPRSSHGRQPTGIDLHSPYTDQLSKVGSHQYSLLSTEAGLHDADHIATQVSNTTPYEFSYYMSEGRRPTDSSPSRQHDISLPPVHQDHHMRTEPQPRRMGETVIPRVGSHGKLSRLQEQHMDLPPNLLPDHRAEIQPFPDIILASDLHRFAVQQQQQQQFVPQPQLHAIDPQQDAYRRSELFHQPVDHSHHQLPMPSLHYHKGGHEGVYRQMEHHHLHQMQEDSFSGHYVHRPGTISTSAYPIGSTSLPAHVGYRDSSGRHIMHQQLSAHRMYNGASHVDLSFGRRPHVHTEQQNASFRTPSSPPHYHDRHIDDRPAMQQQLLNVDPVIQDQGALLYDSAVATRPDILPRASLPQYANPVFQDMPVAYENQGGSEVRRQVAQHAIDNKVLTFGQGYPAASHHNARVECPEVQTAEHPPLHYRYHERIDMTFQQTDDARHSHYMVGRMHPAGNADYADVEFVGDRNVNYISDVMATGLNNLQASEESNHIVGRPGDPYLLAQKRHDNVGGTANAWNSIQPPHAVVGQANKQVPLDAGLLHRPGGIVQTDMHFTEYVNDTQTSENLHVIHGIHNVSEETATESLYTSQLPSHLSLDVHAIPSNGESTLGVETDRGKEVGVFCSHLQESHGDGLNLNEKSLSIKGLMVMDNGVSFSNQKECVKDFLNLVPESFDSSCTTGATQYEKINTTMPVVSILEATPPVAMVASPLVPRSTDLPMPNNIPLLGSPTLTYEIATDESRVNGCEQRAQSEYDFSAQHLAEDVAASVLGSMVSNMTLCENVREAKPHEHDEVVDQLAQTLEARTVKVSANAISSHAYEQSFEEEVTAEVQTEVQELENAESISEVPKNLGEPCQSKISSAEEEAIARGLQTIRNADLEEIKELGSGTFGTVYHGKWRGTDVAIKRIKASCFSGQPSERERLLADFWKEACTLSQLHHPNVVAFYGVVPDGPGGTLATVTEYMVNGSLKQVLQKKDRSIDRKKRLLIAMDAAFGMEYLHGKNIVHFDLKCENLLVNMRDAHRPICKVGDLGLSKIKRQTMVSGGVRGTLPWMAPELLNGSSGMVTEKVDVYSFGIVMWELLTGDEPYATMHYGAIIGGIVNNTLRPLVPDWCDPAWRALMERCWATDPGVRPSFAEIANELRAMTASLQPKPQAQA